MLSFFMALHLALQHFVTKFQILKINGFFRYLGVKKDHLFSIGCEEK